MAVWGQDLWIVGFGVGGVKGSGIDPGGEGERGVQQALRGMMVLMRVVVGSDHDVLLVQQAWREGDLWWHAERGEVPAARSWALRCGRGAHRGSKSAGGAQLRGESAIRGWGNASWGLEVRGTASEAVLGPRLTHHSMPVVSFEPSKIGLLSQ
jgi:hypothetical protein